MARSSGRPFRAPTRFQFDETIWYAQLVTWLPLVSQIVGLCILLFRLIGGAPGLRRAATAGAWSMLAAKLFMCLYGLAGWWIGERQARGVWLAIALFGWPLVALLSHGHVLRLGVLYDVLALVLVVRAGRVIGVRYLAPAPRRG
jgi:hypothetical protein